MKQILQDIIWFQMAIILDVDFETAKISVKNAYKHFKNFDENDDIPFNRKLKRAVLFYSRLKYFLD